MKMTRYILPLLALVAFAGCTKVERAEAPATKISFQAVNYSTQTKAEDPDYDQGGHVSVLNEFHAFKCMAYLHAQGVQIDEDGEEMEITSTNKGYQDFFGTSGETISFTGDEATDDAPASGEWAPSHPYYWPKGEQSYVNFVAWYATDGTNSITPAVAYAQDAQNSNKWTATMTWDFTEDGLPTGANVMYANMAWRYKNNGTSAVHGSSGATQGVPMLFHHALAQIKFQAAADPLESTETVGGQQVKTRYEVYISSVELKDGIINEGTLTLTNDDPIPTTPTPKEWDVDWVLGSVLTGMAYGGSDEPLTVDPEDCTFMQTSVIPQEISEDATVSITYEIWYYDGESTTPFMKESVTVEDIPLYGDDGFSPSIDEWVANTRYTYIININPVTQVIKFLPDAKEWVDGGTGSLPIE